MSQQGNRILLETARNLTCRIICAIRPGCARACATGSLRRRRPTVGDIELLIIPKYHPSLFPDVPGESMLNTVLLSLVEQGRLLRANNGETLKRFYIPHLYERGISFVLEINVSSPERWPVELAIKTGPTAFSHSLVTPRSAGGRLPSDCVIEGGWRVRRDGEVIGFSSEREFIEFCCGEWARPEERE
jgi:DNA polymerase/3'-5' exonuclease PolX